MFVPKTISSLKAKQERVINKCKFTGEHWTEQYKTTEAFTSDIPLSFIVDFSGHLLQVCRRWQTFVARIREEGSFTGEYTTLEIYNNKLLLSCIAKYVSCWTIKDGVNDLKRNRALPKSFKYLFCRWYFQEKLQSSFSADLLLGYVCRLLGNSSLVAEDNHTAGVSHPTDQSDGWI